MIEHNDFFYLNMSYLEASTDDITNKEGIYSWVYWPKLNPKEKDVSSFIAPLNKYKNVNLTYPERTTKFKFTVKVRESSFPQKDTLLGLSIDKERTLLKYLNLEKNRITFSNFFKNMCFSRPFYIGKAICLQKRLKQHLTYKTDLRFEIEKHSNINPNEIWIGINTIELTTDDNLSDIFEEILQRILKPGLTLRPG